MYVMNEDEVAAVRRVIESDWLFRYGEEASETVAFENEWSATIGVNHTIAMTSGTAALVCGLVGLGIGPGDEVIVPGYTFMATALAPLAVGAVPIISEINDSLTIDPSDIERKITPQTRAIIPVHMDGLPCDMDIIMKVAKRHNLIVLEDACQSAGGSFRGQRLGSIGDAGAFSFNYYKILTCGEGGALVTNQQQVYERAFIFHDGGSLFKGISNGEAIPATEGYFAGLNFRTSEILTAILRVQLTRLEGILSALRAEKSYMMEELSGETAFVFNPINDVEGDCATRLMLLFETPQDARSFMQILSTEGHIVISPFDTGRHIFVNWEPVLQQLGAHHPRLDAYQMTAAPVSYESNMYAKTLSVLERTVSIPISPARSQAEAQTLIEHIRKAASRCRV